MSSKPKSGPASPAKKPVPPSGARPAGGRGKGDKEKSADAPEPRSKEPRNNQTAVDSFAAPVREIVKPSNQLQLTEAELAEEMTNSLTASNPGAPKNIARFNFKERCYKFEPMVDQMLTFFAIDGWKLHKSSDDAKRQLEIERLEAEAAADLEKSKENLKEGGEGGGGGGGGEGEHGDDSKMLRNQFNFSERAAQTVNNPLRNRECSTEPPPTLTFSETTTQYAIFDWYMEDQERQRQQKEMAAASARRAREQGDKKAEQQEVAAEPAAKDGKDSLSSRGGMARATKVLERMVNQNTYDEIAQDFKYWEDASDSFREGEGTLLPLWKFYNDRAKRKHVTALCWNPEYSDLFAVGYGSFDFTKQSGGLVCCYSLKNPSHPEYLCSFESGVMAVDFHPTHTSLMAVGLYDGSVAVLDMRQKQPRPIFESTVRTGKHKDPVWQVAWQEEDMSKALSFASVSSDGRVTLWTMSKSELQHQDVMELKLVGEAQEADEDEGALGNLGAGCCFDFNRASDHVFVVGTEEGRIHKCSKASNGQYLETYEGHNLSVYSLRWNAHHPKAFLSASADWTVRLWDHTSPRPVMTFDLNNSVGDVAWAPYSATTFCAVTADGKVHVFDLGENKYEPLCEQKVVRKARLTKVVFNPKHPLLLVGDDRGCVTSLKLSPNLRKTAMAQQGQQQADAEIAKLDIIMETARKAEKAAAIASENAAAAQ